MSGKLCTGSAVNNAGAARLNESKAFCEGMGYRAGGTAITRPFSSNPHVQPCASWMAWDDGWIAADDAAGGNMAKGDNKCCAYPGAILA